MIIVRHAISEGFGLGPWLGRSRGEAVQRRSMQSVFKAWAWRTVL